MSLVFSDTTTYKGIVQTYEQEIGADFGDVSGNTTRLKAFTANANLAFDDFVTLAIKSSGTWKWDDSNHDEAQANYPIITTNIVSGQRDYPFTVDQYDNLILDIYKVLVAGTDGVYKQIRAVDVEAPTNGNHDQYDTQGFYNGIGTSGTPLRYDKMANGIFLDPIPNYNQTNGLKVYINREASYFTYTDTTKKPGVPGLFHKWFAIRPAEDHARRNNLTNYNALRAERMAMEAAITEYFSERPRDERRRMTVSRDSNK